MLMLSCGWPARSLSIKICQEYRAETYCLCVSGAPSGRPHLSISMMQKPNAPSIKAHSLTLLHIVVVSWIERIQALWLPLHLFSPLSSSLLQPELSPYNPSLTLIPETTVERSSKPRSVLRRARYPSMGFRTLRLNMHLHNDGKMPLSRGRGNCRMHHLHNMFKHIFTDFLVALAMAHQIQQCSHFRAPRVRLIHLNILKIACLCCSMLRQPKP